MPEQKGKYSSADIAPTQQGSYTAADVQGSAPQHTMAAPDDDRNGFQKGVDELTKIEPFNQRPGVLGHALTGIGNVGGGALSPLSLLAHPIAAGKSLVNTLSQGMGGAVPGTGPKVFQDTPSMPESLEQSAIDNPSGTAENFLGGLAGSELTGHVMAPYVDAGLAKIGGATERGGLGLGNHALGAKGPKMFQYGQNAARGAYEEGVLPSLTKHSASMKLERFDPFTNELVGAKPKVGAAIGDAVRNSPFTVPSSDIAQSIEGPIDRARGVIEGPGVNGPSPTMLDDLQQSMTRRAPGASRPIYGPQAGTPFSPNEVSGAMGRSPLALPAPTEDIPLASTRGRQPRSSPMMFDAEVNPTSPRLAKPLTYAGRTPGEDLGYLSGSQHPELSGRVPETQGILRMRPTDAVTADGVRGFGESSQPSPFMDMRHPVSSPNDVWQTIQNIDERTRFNPLQPEIESMNDLQKRVRGGLRGNLEDAVPGLKPKSQTYADLSAAQDALERSMHSGTSIGKMLSVPTFPLETGVGAGMFRIGRALQKADTHPLFYAPTAAAPRKTDLFMGAKTP